MLGSSIDRIGLMGYFVLSYLGESGAGPPTFFVMAKGNNKPAAIDMNENK